jgi:H+/Cl- antiporter ClcA
MSTTFWVIVGVIAIAGFAMWYIINNHLADDEEQIKKARTIWIIGINLAVILLLFWWVWDWVAKNQA